MALFIREVEQDKKPESIHPWSKIIKPELSKMITQAHNSITNPVYPPPKKKLRNSIRRITFTVIGNRVTKEFIHCVNLVKGMHRCRWDMFDAPVIKAVTGVEWPHVLKELQRRSGASSYCLLGSVAVLYNNKFLGGVNELKELIETKYCYHLSLNYYKEAINEFRNFVKSTNRACAYLHISIAGNPIGTLIFMLYSELAPLTCENFLRLCKEKRGGYSGTPVHRIVKDCWIQCGGFGLKNTPLDCESYVVPHDKRGVLGMCNAERNVDCSTQFFVLLQPSEWMKNKYVAFGQLIDGEETLKKIEAVPTFYESPTEDIIIFDSGILNTECQDIMINRGAVEYIDGHIDDLAKIGEIFYEMLLERLWLDLEFREVMKLEQHGEFVSEDNTSENTTKDIRETKRFIREKAELQSQYQKARELQEKKQVKFSKIPRKDKESVSERLKDVDENENFDVEDYVYEPEEYQYSQVTPIPLASKPFYVPLTDVPYPGEVDSHFDLKRFLQGDYCLESDLDPNKPANKDLGRTKHEIELRSAILSEIFHSYADRKQADDTSESSEESSVDLDSDEEDEIREFLEYNAEKVSFPGRIVKKIAKKFVSENPVEKNAPNEKFNDEEVRRIRLAAEDYLSRRNKKVSLNTEPWQVQKAIKRRQTGYLRPMDLKQILQEEMGEFEDFMEYLKSLKTYVEVKKQNSYCEAVNMADDDYDWRLDRDEEKRKVRIAVEDNQTRDKQTRVKSSKSLSRMGLGSVSQGRPSALLRLYQEVAIDSYIGVPTLRDYKYRDAKSLTFMSQNLLSRADNLLRKSDESFDVRHHSGQKATDRFKSTDFTSTVDTRETLRSKGFGTNRPRMSVAEYKWLNSQNKEKNKETAERRRLHNELASASHTSKKATPIISDLVLKE